MKLRFKLFYYFVVFYGILSRLRDVFLNLIIFTKDRINRLRDFVSSSLDLNGNSCRVEESNEEQEDAEESQSECSNSLYAVFDPFDYMYSPSETSQISDPIYAAVIKTPVRSPPPLPARTYNNISSPAVATDFYVSMKKNYL